MSNLKRKFLGMLAGGFIGLVAMFVPTRSTQAFGGFGGMSVEDQFNEFIEKGGGLLLRILGYRYMYNWQKRWDEYTEDRTEQEDKNAAAKTEADTRANQAIIDAIKEKADHQLELETYVEASTCFSDQTAVEIDSSAQAYTKKITLNASEYIEKYLRGNSETNNFSYLRLAAEATQNQLSDDNKIKFKQLDKIIGDELITSIPEVYNELALIMSDFQFKTNLNTNDHTLAQAKQLELNGKISVVIHALAKLIALRAATIEKNTVPLSHLSPDLKSKYSDTYLSELLLIKFQIESVAFNSEYIKNFEDNPSFTSSVGEYMKQLALSNRIKLLNSEIDDLRVLVSSIGTVQ